MSDTLTQEVIHNAPQRHGSKNYRKHLFCTHQATNACGLPASRRIDKVISLDKEYLEWIEEEEGETYGENDIHAPTNPLFL